MKSICVFCGSSKGNRDVYLHTAKELGAYLASQNIDIVFGGGKVGLMGAIADSTMENEGRAIGVIPRSLYDKEVGHEGVSDLIVVDTMHERKRIMYERSDAFIALPGGFGTLDEFCEILTWSQLGYHKKPVAFLNVDGYFDHLLAQFEHSLKEGFISQEHFDLLLVEEKIEDLIEKLKTYEHRFYPKWIIKDV